jgi:hypothetical protein
MGQQFRPPKIWDGIVPPHNTSEASDPQKTKEAELGMKLVKDIILLLSVYMMAFTSSILTVSPLLPIFFRHADLRFCAAPIIRKIGDSRILRISN